MEYFKLDILKKSFLAICLMLLVVPGYAQRKQIGEARTILLRGKDFAKAEKMMTDLLKDSVHRDNKRIYDVWLQAVEKQYAQLNEKMYIKQKVDTAQLFTLTQRLSGYRPNLFFGGAYYIRKQDFRKAFNFFESYIDCDRQPLFEGYDLLNTDPRMGEAAYWATYCGYRMNDPLLSLRYVDLARRDTARLENTLQYIAEAGQRLGNDSLYRAALWEGFCRDVKSPYFFPRLMDSYTSQGNYKMADKVVDEALQADSLNELFLFAKSTVLLNLQRYADCLRYSERLLALNPDASDAYYNAGLACVNIAQNIDHRKYKKQVKRMYQRALPYMEAYRRLVPDAKDKWGPALYRIYFNLNMGKQFDEVDKILKK